MDGAGDSDAELLRAYAERGSEEAFRRLVERHSAMVYAACARSLAPQDAEDATQAVFLLLARRARRLTQLRALGGWLYRTARLVAAEARRSASRRVRREERAVRERSGAVDNSTSAAAGEVAAAVRPRLDDCLAQLRQKQQDAIVLHYLQGKSIRDTAAALDCSEDTVKKRIAYGLEKLRALLARNGLALSVATLVPVLQSEAARTAPPALLNSCAAAAVAHGAAAGPPALLAQGVSKTMLMLKVKVAAAVAIVLLGAGFSVNALKKPLPPLVTHGDQDTPPPPPAPAQPAPVQAIASDPGWDADPFAGTRAIDVTHGPERYIINDPAVIRTLLQALTIDTIQNGFGVLSEPSTRLIFDRGPRGTFNVNIDSDAYCSVAGGTLRLSPKFLELLNAECTRQGGAPFKFDEYRHVPAKPRPQLKAASLTSGIKSVVLSYSIGGHGRELPLTDPQDLQAFTRAFNIVALTPRKHLEKKLDVWAHFTATLGDGSELSAMFEDENLVSTNIGNVQFKPELQQTIAALIKKFEGREIDPLRENPPSEAEAAASAKALALLRSAEKVTITADDKHQPVDIPLQIPHPMQPFNFVLVRPNEPAVPAAANGMELKVSVPNAEPITVKFLDQSALKADVICRTPVEISGIGRAWIDDKWRQFYQNYIRGQDDKLDKERAIKTAARVMQDFEGFKKQVLCATAMVTENGQTLIYNVPQREISRLIAELKPAKLTAQANTADSKLDAHLELDLTPGIGFDLQMKFISDSTAEIRGWGVADFGAPVVPELLRIIKAEPAPMQAHPPSDENF